MTELTVHEAPAPHRYVLGDWGTSRLRLFLVENDRLTDRRDGPGIGALPSSAASVLQAHLEDWAGPSPLTVYLTGMAGARGGLCETEYLPVPIAADEWATDAVSVSLPRLSVRIGRGLRSPPGNVPDVMRGEETQVFGALCLDDTLSHGSHLLVLPGTHCKWVHLTGGVITAFRTAITGELFALLRDRSTLTRLADATPGAPGDETAGFLYGTRQRLGGQGSVAALLFQARAAQLLCDRSQPWALGLISGVLLADEIASLDRSQYPDNEIVLIGEDHLCLLYREVFASRGLACRLLPGDACVIEGLRTLRASHCKT